MRAGLGAVVLVAQLGCGRIAFERERPDPDAAPGDGGVAITKFSQLDAAGQTTCGVFRGRAYCWGANDGGQLGVGDRIDRGVPSKVQLPAGVVTQVDVGLSHGCALLDGAAWCWGTAALGDGVTNASTTPIAVVGLPSPVAQISAGLDFTCAIAGGEVYCWGSDGNQRLGNGAAGASAVPVRVLTGPARQVVAGGDHACAVRTDGSAWCWGHNDGPGALGLGITTDTIDTPMQVVDRAGFTAITIAGYHGCGLDAGAAWCWGTGDSGELGDGMRTSSTRPVAVRGLEQQVDHLHTGGGPTSADSTCAVRDRALWCWGSGLWGRLGNRVAEDLTTPAIVAGLGAVVTAAVGWYHSCAIVDDGEIECWGRGDRGELGNDTTASTFDPVRVVLPP